MGSVGRWDVALGTRARNGSLTRNGHETFARWEDDDIRFQWAGRKDIPDDLVRERIDIESNPRILGRLIGRAVPHASVLRRALSLPGTGRDLAYRLIVRNDCPDELTHQGLQELLHTHRGWVEDQLRNEASNRFAGRPLTLQLLTTRTDLRIFLRIQPHLTTAPLQDAALNRLRSVLGSHPDRKRIINLAARIPWLPTQHLQYQNLVEAFSAANQSTTKTDDGATGGEAASDRKGNRVEQQAVTAARQAALNVLSLNPTVTEGIAVLDQVPDLDVVRWVTAVVQDNPDTGDLALLVTALADRRWQGDHRVSNQRRADLVEMIGRRNWDALEQVATNTKDPDIIRHLMATVQTGKQILRAVQQGHITYPQALRHPQSDLDVALGVPLDKALADHEAARCILEHLLDQNNSTHLHTFDRLIRGWHGTGAELLAAVHELD